MKVGFLWYDGRYTIETIEQHQSAYDVGIVLINRYDLVENEISLAVDGRRLGSTENVAEAVTNSATLSVAVNFAVPATSVAGQSGQSSSRSAAAASTASVGADHAPRGPDDVRGALSISLVPGASLKIEPNYYQVQGTELRIDPKLASEVSAGLRLVPRRPLDGLTDLGLQMWSQPGGFQDWLGQLGLLGIITGILVTAGSAKGLEQWPYLRWILLAVLMTGTSIILMCVLLGYNFQLMPYLRLPKVYPEASRAEELVSQVPVQRVMRLDAGADADKILDTMRQRIGIWGNVALFFVSLVPPVYADWEAAVTARRAMCRDAVILAIEQYRPPARPVPGSSSVAGSASGSASGSVAVPAPVIIPAAPSTVASGSQVARIGDILDSPSDSDSEFFASEGSYDGSDSEAEFFTDESEARLLAAMPLEESD